VGDLALEATVDIKSNEGTLLLDLVEAGRHYQCAINIADGQAKLTITGLDGEVGAFSDDAGTKQSDFVTGPTSVKGTGRHKLLFANVDNQLTLWVDGKVVAFSGPTTYDPPAGDVPQWTDTDDGDLAPVGIGSDGVTLEVERLKVLRDVYYIAVRLPEARSSRVLHDYDAPLYDVRRVLFRPREMFETEAGTFRGVFAARRSVEFGLGADQFFAMGDNSPQSQDARIWDDRDRHYVHRDYLLGKALFIYWPHMKKWGPIPFVPNFERMGFVR
jgi:signal peptidase I